MISTRNSSVAVALLLPGLLRAAPVCLHLNVTTHPPASPQGHWEVRSDAILALRSGEAVVDDARQTHLRVPVTPGWHWLRVRAAYDPVLNEQQFRLNLWPAATQSLTGLYTTFRRPT